MREIKCASYGCRWNQKGKCLLFRGVTGLECKYRIKPTTNTKKKGK